jgi:hypothetical protein
METNSTTLFKKYKRYESINNHNLAAKLLVDNFGTDDEKKTMKEIITRYNKIGYITYEDYELRYSISQKYYPLISK